jgi:hypothetical protein
MNDKNVPSTGLKLTLTKDQLLQIEKDKARRIEAAKHSWKKLGNIAYVYIYQDRNTFGEGKDQVPAEVLARIMEATGRYELDVPSAPTSYRLKPGHEDLTVSEMADLFFQYNTLIATTAAV